MWHIHSEGPLYGPRAICFTGSRYTEEGVAQNEANARLIAAAPELYEALAMVVAALDASRDGGRYPDFEVWETTARAALAKAAPADVSRSDSATPPVSPPPGSDQTSSETKQEGSR
jgi:hypothetical protein